MCRCGASHGCLILLLLPPLNLQLLRRFQIHFEALQDTHPLQYFNKHLVTRSRNDRDGNSRVCTTEASV